MVCAFLAFAGVFERGMLGGQALLRFVKLRGFLFGVDEASSAETVSFLSVSAAGSRSASTQ